MIIELALILGIAGVLAGGTYVALSSARKSQMDSLESAALASARNALQNFVLSEKRLPRPDMNGDGYECAVSTCAVGGKAGLFPYATVHIDNPVIPDGQVLRYGVWRGASDLTEKAAGLAADADGSRKFLSLLLAAAKATGGIDEPYVAAVDFRTLAVQCQRAVINPAVLLAVDAREKTSLCFADKRTGGQQTMSISRLELLGWAHAKFR